MIFAYIKNTYRARNVTNKTIKKTLEKRWSPNPSHNIILIL